MSKPRPSFFSQDWRVHSVQESPIVVRMGHRADKRVDVEVVTARCDAMLREVSTMLGLSPPQPCVVERADDDHLVLIEVVDVPRLVVAELPGEGVDRCGYGPGLDPDARAVVLALERVFLNDPSLLLLAGSQPDQWQGVKPEMSGELELVAELLERGVNLRNVTSAALAYAEGSDPAARVMDISSWVNDCSVRVQLIGSVDDARSDVWAAFAADVVERAPLGLGMVCLPAVIEPIVDDPYTEEAPWVAAGNYARLMVGALPAALVPDPPDLDDERLAELDSDLRRAAWRSVDTVTVTMRLDRLALYVPQTVRALRLMAEDRLLATSLCLASRQVVITDLLSLVDDLVQHGVPDDLLGHPTIGPRLVERYLSSQLRQTSPLNVVKVEPRLEQRLAGSSGEPWKNDPDLRESVAGVLRHLADAMSGAPWGSGPVSAVIVSEPAARESLRAILRHQAPDSPVIAPSDIPEWVSQHALGLLSLSRR